MFTFDIYNITKDISEANCTKDLLLLRTSLATLLGLFTLQEKKGYYTDEHNRKDVVKYRDEVFLKEMEMYEPRMKDYDDEEMKETICY